MRLLDSLIMTVQLNIRKLLQVGGSRLASESLSSCTCLPRQTSMKGRCPSWLGASNPAQVTAHRCRITCRRRAAREPTSSARASRQATPPTAHCTMRCDVTHLDSSVVPAGGGLPGHQHHLRAHHGGRAADAVRGPDAAAHGRLRQQHLLLRQAAAGAPQLLPMLQADAGALT